MNCQEFQQYLPELARGEEFYEERLKDARLHGLACPSCAERLREQLELTAGLQLLARADERLEASPQTEAGLLRAFRSQPRRKFARLQPAMAAAAMVVLALLAARSYRPGNAARRLNAGKKPRATIRPGEARELRHAAAADSGVQAGAMAPPSPSRIRERRSKPAAASAKVSPGAARPLPQNGGAPEVATDFIPLPYGSAFEPIAGGQIVRIRLPRSALRSVGLPVNEERGSGEVDADVILGEDMSVRAIRFIQ